MKKFLLTAVGLVVTVVVGWVGINWLADVVLTTTIGG